MTTAHRLPVSLTALLVVPADLLAQAAPPPALPSPQALVARYVDAIGGRAAIESLPARLERGRMEIPSAGMTIRYELWTAPNRQYSRAELAGLGVIRSGYDGEVAWSINPAVGPMILDGVAAQQARQGADPLAVLHPDRYVASMQTLEETDFGGARCYRVKVTTPWNEEYSEFYDRETGLLAGGIRAQASPQGNIEITAQVTEYRTVAGVRLPRVTRARMMGTELVNTVDSTEVRAIPDSVFALPPEIRALRGGR